MPNRATTITPKGARNLSTVSTVAEAVKEMSIGSGAVAMAKRVGLSIRQQNIPARHTIEAAARAGELLDGISKKPGSRTDITSGNVAGGLSEYEQALSDAGVNPKDAYRWRQLHKLGEDKRAEIMGQLDDRCLEITIAALLKKDPALSGSGGISNSEGYDSDEWYTPQEYIEAARTVLGGIDLDPASCEVANKSIGASRIYTKDDNGLEQEWHGRVWLNPPYSQPLARLFGEKLLAELAAGRTTAAIMVQNASTDTEWFHALASVSTVCLTRGRINFNRSDGDSAANRYGQVFFYFGKNAKSFAEKFGPIGLVGELR